MGEMAGVALDQTIDEEFYRWAVADGRVIDDDLDRDSIELNPLFDPMTQWLEGRSFNEMTLEDTLHLTGCVPSSSPFFTSDSTHTLPSVHLMEALVELDHNRRQSGQAPLVVAIKNQITTYTMVKGFIAYFGRNGELTPKQQRIIETNWTGGYAAFRLAIEHNSVIINAALEKHIRMFGSMLNMCKFNERLIEGTDYERS